MSTIGYNRAEVQAKIAAKASPQTVAYYRADVQKKIQQDIAQQRQVSAASVNVIQSSTPAAESYYYTREQAQANIAARTQAPETVASLPQGAKITAYNPQTKEITYRTAAHEVAYQQSVRYYTDIGYPQYGGNYAPLSVPSGMKVATINEVPTSVGGSSLEVTYVPTENKAVESAIKQTDIYNFAQSRAGGGTSNPLSEQLVVTKEGNLSTVGRQQIISGLSAEDRATFLQYQTAQGQKKLSNLGLLMGSAVAAPILGPVGSLEAIAGGVGVSQAFKTGETILAGGDWQSSLLTPEEFVTAAETGVILSGIGKVAIAGISLTPAKGIVTGFGSGLTKTVSAIPGRIGVNAAIGGGANYVLSGGSTEAALQGVEFGAAFGALGEIAGAVKGRIAPNALEITGAKEIELATSKGNLFDLTRQTVFETKKVRLSQNELTKARANLANEPILDMAGTEVTRSFREGGEVTTFGRVSLTDVQSRLATSKATGEGAVSTEIFAERGVFVEDLAQAQKAYAKSQSELQAAEVNANIVRGTENAFVLSRETNVEFADINSLARTVKNYNKGVDIGVSRRGEAAVSAFGEGDFQATKTRQGKVSDLIDIETPLGGASAIESVTISAGRGSVRSADLLLGTEGKPRVTSKRTAESSAVGEPGVLLEKTVEAISNNKIGNVFPKETTLKIREFSDIKIRSKADIASDLETYTVGGKPKTLASVFPEELAQDVYLKAGGGYRNVTSETNLDINNPNFKLLEKQFAQGKGVTVDTEPLAGSMKPIWESIGSSSKIDSATSKAVSPEDYAANLKAGKDLFVTTQKEVATIQKQGFDRAIVKVLPKTVSEPLSTLAVPTQTTTSVKQEQQPSVTSIRSPFYNSRRRVQEDYLSDYYENTYPESGLAQPNDIINVSGAISSAGAYNLFSSKNLVSPFASLASNERTVFSSALSSNSKNTLNFGVGEDISFRLDTVEDTLLGNISQTKSQEIVKTREVTDEISNTALTNMYAPPTQFSLPYLLPEFKLESQPVRSFRRGRRRNLRSEVEVFPILSGAEVLKL